MNEEPVYEFVKGKGWVATSLDTRTTRIGLWEVTLTKRKPEVGEYYFTGPLDLDQMISILSTGSWSHTFAGTNTKNHMNVYGDRLYPEDKALVVVKLRLLDANP